MCRCENVSAQEYGGQILVKIPDFINLHKNDGEMTKREYLSIDVCILPEVFWLWKKGIRTTGCCCGHNKYTPYIGVVEEDIQKMKDLGYKVQINECDKTREDTFYPKGEKNS